LERADLGGRVGGVADGERGDLGDELLGELGLDGAVDQDAVGGHADLALVDVPAEDRRVDGVVDIGVVEHDQGAVAAEFEDGALEVPGADGGDVAADLVRAGEGDDLRHGVLQQGVADLRDIGDHDVQQSGGQPGVLEDPGQQGATADRGVLVRLEDDGVAEGQRGRDGLEGEQEGEVERADHTDDPDGHPVDAVLLALGRRGEDLSGGAQGQLDRLAEELLGQVQFEGGLQPGAAELGDDGLTDLRFALLDEVQRLLQNGPPAVRVGLRPRVLGALGGAVGLVDLVGGGDRDRCELLSVERVEVDDVPGPLPRPPLAVDVLVGQVSEEGHEIPYRREAGS
jgi:hypothetical protein